MIELAIVGGGPVGLFAAIEAARRGLHPVVFERKPGVIDKACGEGLMPAAVEALEDAGVEVPRWHRFEGIRYVNGTHVAEARFRHGVGWGVRRLVLHEALAARARALGVEVRQVRVRGVAPGQPARLDVDGVAVTAKAVLVADGLQSPLRKALGLQRAPRRPRRYGMRRHFRVAPWSPFVEVHWHPRMEAYVTPVAADEVGIAVLFDDRSRGREGDGRPVYDRLLDGFPAFRERLDAPCSAVRGAGPFEQRTAGPRVGNVLLVGDASGYLDPLTGEGLRLGFAASKAAITSLIQGRPECYDRRWRGVVRRYWWLTAGLLALRNSPLRPWLVPLSSNLPYLFAAAVNLLAEGSEQPHLPSFRARFT